MNTFWDCDQLLFEDLPTVRDLIWNADWDILAKELVDCEGRGQGETAQLTLEEMMRLEVRDPSEKWLFLPFEYYSADCLNPQAIRCEIDAALLRRRDFEAIEELHEKDRLLESARDCRRFDKRACKRMGDKYPNLYSWALCPWAKVLSFRVWMRGEYSRKERYQALARIVSEMTRCGDTWDDVRSEQRLLKKRLKRNARAFSESGRARSSRIEALMRNYGLESSADDYESAFMKRGEDRILVLNHNASVDLHNRVADLAGMIRRAEREGARTDPRPHGSR